MEKSAKLLANQLIQSQHKVQSPTEIAAYLMNINRSTGTPQKLAAELISRNKGK